MSLIDPNMVHIAEFPEYSEILYAHRLAVNSDPEEMFVGQRFESGNKNVLPIAFAIVDKENMESWEFFLTNLRMRSGVPWRFVYCIWYIAANFHQDYKNAD
ncbi:hypothetical protein GOBAR_AA12500 [Gossypium barbadense]|uniref:MULE transposase domain-containing protein n=1 Tax=Gossypium barbadense TaxID=3634 RepID=A0A2P5XXS8_GOSBA|nr:hypothetical protein GOBAR_AA12500 [Gossypium barbadense]